MIKIYTKENCPHCVAVKGFLERNNVEFELLDITTNEKAKQEVLDMGFRSVPVTMVPNQDPIVGFDIKRLKGLTQ